MGARWAWDAVCPNLHVYSNFSGGADPCYECGEEPEMVFEDDNSRLSAAEYAEKRRAGMSVKDFQREEDLAELIELAARLGYELVPLRS